MNWDNISHQVVLAAYADAGVVTASLDHNILNDAVNQVKSAVEKLPKFLEGLVKNDAVKALPIAVILQLVMSFVSIFIKDSNVLGWIQKIIDLVSGFFPNVSLAEVM